MSTFLLKNRKAIYTRLFTPTLYEPSSARGEGLEITQNIGTRDEAPYRSLQWKVQSKQLFRTLRPHGKPITKNQLEVLVSNWLESA
ncbi:MAG: hypothetical protein OJF51_002887 [Nitrospira sp.]|nr:MAG: hypothetical protein OJF51_002887 [Nitrospira sp.]